MHAHNVCKMKADSENTRNKENREIIESVRFENGSSVVKLSSDYDNSTFLGRWLFLYEKNYFLIFLN